MVLERPELRLRVGIVVRGPRPREAVLQPEELDQVHGPARLHGAAAVIVDGEPVAGSEMPVDSLADEALCPPRVLPFRHHPADDIAGEDVDHDVEEEELAPPWSL